MLFFPASTLHARTVATVRSTRTAERRLSSRGQGRGRGRGRTGSSRRGSKRKARSRSSGKQKKGKKKVSKSVKKKTRGTKRKKKGTKKSRTKRQKTDEGEAFFELQFGPPKRGRTVRARIQESLGTTGSTSGELGRNLGRRPFPGRVEPSASFSLFGNSFALHDFNDANEQESAGKDEERAMTSAWR